MAIARPSQPRLRWETAEGNEATDVMIKIALGMLAAVDLAGQARAAGEFFDGNQLDAYCTSSVDYERGLCLGYIEGVVEYMEAVRSNNGKPRCVPPGTDSKEVLDAVVNYLRDQPQDRSKAPIWSVNLAVITAWKCP
jgi:Ssp1 endopeptidase immunity protein Rap1a